MSMPKSLPKFKPSERVDINQLRNVTLFSALKDIDEALEVLAGLMSFRNFNKDQKILTEGDNGSELFIILEGEVAVYKATPQGDRYKVADLKGARGLFFGEGGLLDQDSRSATIEATGFCRCLVLHREDFSEFSNNYPQWALPVVMQIASLVNNRLRKTNQDLLLLYNALVAEIQGS